MSERDDAVNVPRELSRANPGCYGTNEGDIWASDGSVVQNLMDKEQPGQKLIHEIVDGEEKLYVVDTHAGLWQKETYERAKQGSKKYAADQGLGSFGIGGGS
jgi:hypothetical protein